MKTLGKRIIVALSWRIVSRLLAQQKIKIVAVTGSVGKTSTKRAIALTLSEKYKVRWQDGNYNDVVSVPLVFFGLDMPSLTNPVAWLRTLQAMKAQVKNYKYDVVVLELGTDAPAQIAEFGKYLKVDIGVVTPITPEHMEFFGSIDAVAKEELSLQAYAKVLIVNEKGVEKFGQYINQKPLTYGSQKTSDAFLAGSQPKAIIKTNQEKYVFSSRLLGDHQLNNLSAVALVAEELGLSVEQVERGLAGISPMSGRMQILSGIKNSKIIDDTYNSSPEAVRTALDTLYAEDANSRIAVLGNMNEMGELSPELHKQVGEQCDAKKLDLVITIGPDANRYLAESAEKKGCKVIQTQSPYDAGEVLKHHIKDGSVVLLKGSQNGVFLEEAIKSILANEGDHTKLVRQSKSWLAKKQKMFG